MPFVLTTPGGQPVDRTPYGSVSQTRRGVLPSPGQAGVRLIQLYSTIKTLAPGTAILGAFAFNGRVMVHPPYVGLDLR